jgi:hypothetical protein
MVATWKIVLASLLIFAAGVLTGGITTGAAIRASRGRPQRATQTAPANPPPPAPGKTATNRLPASLFAVQRIETFRRVGNQIGIDAAQRSRIEALTAESTERLRALWAPVAPRLQQEVRELRKQIAAELTPEQRARFDALLEKRAQPAPSIAQTNAPAPPALAR